MEKIESHEYHGVELESVPTSVLVWMVDTYGPLGAGRWFVKDRPLYVFVEMSVIWILFLLEQVMLGSMLRMIGNQIVFASVPKYLLGRVV
jgi:hypothetical protein